MWGTVVLPWQQTAGMWNKQTSGEINENLINYNNNRIKLNTTARHFIKHETKLNSSFSQSVFRCVQVRSVFRCVQVRSVWMCTGEISVQVCTGEISVQACTGEISVQACTGEISVQVCTGEISQCSGADRWAVEEESSWSWSLALLDWTSSSLKQTTWTSSTWPPVCRCWPGKVQVYWSRVIRQDVIIVTCDRELLQLGNKEISAK